MFLSDARRQQASHGLGADAAFADRTSYPMQTGLDDQLIADCRLLTCRIDALISGINQAAEDCEGEQESDQASLCEADDLAFKLMERVAVTRAITVHGAQSKHAVADFLLAIDWYPEPSPTRDALLLSFVCDAAGLRYPAPPEVGSHVSDPEATTTVIVHSNTCLSLIKELAAAFAQKDENDALGQAEPDDLDAKILTIKERKKAAIEALVGVCASSSSAVHAKRVVLRRMLEAGDGDAHYLRIELARSYFSDLNAFIEANAQEHEHSSGYNSIWNALSNKFRWLTSAAHHR